MFPEPAKVRVRPAVESDVVKLLLIVRPAPEVGSIVFTRVQDPPTVPVNPPLVVMDEVPLNPAIAPLVTVMVLGMVSPPGFVAKIAPLFMLTPPAKLVDEPGIPRKPPLIESVPENVLLAGSTQVPPLLLVTLKAAP